MSQMIPFAQAQLPAFLQGQINPEQAKQMNMAAAHGAGGTAAPNRISIKQGKFRLVVNGQETQVLHNPALNVIVLRVNDGITKTYFAKEYNPNEDAERPDCSSDDGVAPRADSPTPQCANCAQCPQNQFGSKINRHTGAKVKACSDTKRFAIVPESQPGGDPYQVSVPPASLKDFGAYLRQLASLPQAVPYNAVVTEISFDMKADHPKLLFRPVRYLTDAEYATVQARYNDDNVKYVAGMAEAQPEHIPVQQLSGQAPAQVQQTQVQQPAQTQQQASGEWGTQAQQVQQPQQSAGEWGGQQAQPQQAQPQQVQQQESGPVHPSGRPVGKPSAGKTRRNSAEVAEDDAYYSAQQGGQVQTMAQGQQQAQPQQQLFDASNPFGQAPGIQPQQAQQTQVAATAPVVSDPALAGVFGGGGWDD